MTLAAVKRVWNLTTRTSGVERADRLLGRVDLGHADPVGRVDDLALEVRDVDDVVVDDAEGADAGRREVQRGRRPEPAGAEQEHAGVEELLLAGLADLGQQEVARVAGALLGRVRAGHLDRVAAVLPQRDAAGHGLHVRVAEVLQRLGGQGRAGARRAVQDDALGAVGDRALDAGLEEAAGDVRGAGELALGDLVGLADVDDGDALVEEAVDVGGIDLVDLALDLLDELGTGWHGFRKCRN
jgi:hypothetical protein